MHQTTVYFRLGIDEELVALLGRHSPVSDLGVSFCIHDFLSLVLVSSYLPMLSLHYCYFVMKCPRANVLDRI